MLVEHERTYGLSMDALLAYALGTRREYGLGMDALVSVCSWNTNGIMVWECDSRMLLEQERNYGLAIDALETVCSWNTNGIPTAPQENHPHTPRVWFVPRRNMNRAPSTLGLQEPVKGLAVLTWS